MARAIDAEKVLKHFRFWIETNQVKADERKAIETCIKVIENTPTLTPPNEPRMINADKLAKRIAGHSNYHGDSILAAIYCAAEGKENNVPIQPIETSPNEWVSVEERLPEKKQDVLMLFKSGNMAVGWWHDVDKYTTFWYAYTDDGVYIDCDDMPSHWRTLPAPPKKEE